MQNATTMERWASGANGPLADALADAGGASGVEAVARPLLAALQELTGLGTTFLASIDWDAEIQTVEFASRGGPLTMPEQVGIPWEQTLCRRAMNDGLISTNQVRERWGDNALATAMGVRTYVTSPVELAHGEVYGTLCGASTDVLGVGEHTTNLLRMFSGLVADAVTRERELRASKERAAAAEHRLRERAMFLAVAEHKLKTPLTVLRGWASLLVNPAMPAERRDEAARAISDTAERLGVHVSEMLQEATAHVVASELEPSELDLEPFLSQVASDLDGLSPSHTVRAHVPGGIQVRMDGRSLRIAVEHLVENAVKYSPGGGDVDIVVDPVVDGSVTVRVRDHGPGLPDDVDVFEPFERGDSGTEGTGLGLHIVRSLVEAMGGEIHVGDDAVGTEIVVVLPTG